MYRLKSFGHIATLIVAVAAILGISAGELLKERRQLLEELGAAQSSLADSAAHDIGDRFAALERDTKILANLVSGNRLPGVARTVLFAALAWARPEGWRAQVDARAVGHGDELRLRHGGRVLAVEQNLARCRVDQSRQ